jgi:hypothetical protein
MYDHEIEIFKRDVHLVQFASERYGYVRDKRESSRACHVLRHEPSDDKIVVRRDNDGHWTYFSVRDGRDQGTVIDFVLMRGGRGLREACQELRGYLGMPRKECEPPPERARTGVAPDPAQAFAQARQADNSLYLNARGIRPETLQDPRFAGTWRMGSRDNVLFAHTDDAGALTGFEIKNHGFTGFATGGRKAAWQSVARPSDRALVVTEGAIDALSHHQLHRESADKTRYLSTAGAPGRGQLELVDRILGRLPAMCWVVAAFDADDAGDALARRIQAMARSHHPQLAFVRDVPPCGKDWNEVLQQVERDFIRSLAGRQHSRAGPER